ncbi:type II toxin-antitoxin system HicB family antitoxin [Microcoleus sp. LAD1_D1]|uniref:type II toxin-antitoxin system HicB family antitoxin n=1 Tax=unclassified Microcoleus TaxID=2642155 RepID=UPI002FCF42AA
MRYAVVIEKGETSYGAYVPDLRGCVAVAESLEEVRNLIKEAIAFHIEGLQEDAFPIPNQCLFANMLKLKKVTAVETAAKETKSACADEERK